MKALDMAEGRGPNPYYAGNFDGESDELRDLRLTLVAERDALKAELEAEREESKRWLVTAQNERDARKELEAELDALKAENERLTNCLKKANDQAEDFERRWYLVDMELERIKSLPPIAWEVYVADADNAYVVESLDDPQLIDDCTNSDAVVTPLIALGSKTS